jgi:hypothetical protein
MTMKKKTTLVVVALLALAACGPIADPSPIPTSDASTADASPEASDLDAYVCHSNGLGQSWCDDVPLGTYDATQATAACIAFKQDTARCTAFGSDICYASPSPANYCECWALDGKVYQFDSRPDAGALTCARNPVAVSTKTWD